MHRKKCSICGSPFKSEYSRAKRCLECKGKSDKPMKVDKIHTRKCLICDKKFKSPYPRAKYCSDNCRSEANITIYEMRKKIYPGRCIVCGLLFEAIQPGKKYCSDKCRKENLRRRREHKRQEYKPKPLIAYKCVICGKTFSDYAGRKSSNVKTRTRKYCSRLCCKVAQKSNIIRWKVLNRDNFRCQYCGRTPQDGIKLVLDHITPRMKGGLTTLDNLVSACELCNLQKTDNPLDDEAKFKKRVQRRAGFAIPQGYFSFLTEAEWN